MDWYVSRDTFMKLAGNNYSRDSHPGEKSHERETPIEFNGKLA